MTSASNKSLLVFQEADVWLDVGREGKCFTYIDRHRYDVNTGDLVLVRLRGRLMQGLVVAKRPCISLERRLADIEKLVQRAAVDSQWQEWLEAMAASCYTSSFRMLKAALPPGWLGQRDVSSSEPRLFWWVCLKYGDFSNEKLPSRQAALVAELSVRGGGGWQKDLQNEGFSLGVIKSLILNGRAFREKREFNPLGNTSIDLQEDKFEKELPQALTDEQQSALNTYESQSPGEALLLWGVTGSGKTEVYLQIADRELNKGNSCLILTPEIGLIPQLVDRFKRRFGSKVFEYHSGCSNRERVATWRECLTSSVPLIIVGTRSSIFLPLSLLGLIVLDEEHDSSYKQESPMPCYHARDLALDRAHRTGAKVVLGTATPSLSTWKSIYPEGEIVLARLTRRISNRPLPEVNIVDMRQELASGHRHLVSRKLMEYLRKLPEKNEQAVVLVPRRGYNTFLSCRSCGEVVQCPNCDVALSVHRKRNGYQWLRCHWCDHREEIEVNCKYCGSKAFKPFGAGTQRVMEQLSEELQELRLLRFDRDSTGGRDGHRKLLEQFASGKADVLVGTQMLAKGMDLPRVTLAAVIAADGLLHRPDLQATEQSLQLMMQLAGRAGRGELPGKVFVQTYCPQHPVIIHLVDGRYEEFLKHEGKLRHEARLVPYSRACLLRLSGEFASITATAAAALAERLRPLCESKGWVLIGPAPSMVARVAGRSRWQLLLHGPEKSELPLPKGTTLWNELPRGVFLSIDPDPIQL